MKARYGQGIDAARYLQKFVHLYFSLPDQIHDTRIVYKYMEYLGKELGISEELIQCAREVCKFAVDQQGITLRGVERFLSIVVIIEFASPYSSNTFYGYRIPIIIGAFLKSFVPTAYDHFKTDTLTLELLGEVLLLSEYWQAAMIEVIDRASHTTETREYVRSLFRHRPLEHESNILGGICSNFIEAFDFDNVP